MDPRNMQAPMYAKSAETPSTSPSPRLAKARATAKPSPAIDADTTAKRILALLAKDLYLPARGLAAEAIERFPDHPELKKLWRVFDNRGKSWIAPGGPEPGRKEEFEWLRHPPEWAHGKWVALIGCEAVATGDTLREVTESVRSQKFSRRPLVHRID
jgi:hypothetical protein